MTRDDIIRMAKEAGFNQILATTTGADVWIDDGFYLEKMERFAALVAAAEREAVGNIISDYAGRDDLSDSDESLLKHLFELIRARGET
jgi:hypothetical protein